MQKRVRSKIEILLPVFRDKRSFRWNAGAVGSDHENMAKAAPYITSIISRGKRAASEYEEKRRSKNKTACTLINTTDTYGGNRMQRYCWHYLYNSSTGRTQLERMDTRQVSLKLPNFITDTEEEYLFAFDERDQRTLVAFDGYLLTGSPNRKGACICRIPIGTLQVPQGQFYSPKKDELGVPPYKHLVGGKIVALEIYRYFLLLRAGTFVFAGYDSTNLSPRYLIALVRKGGKQGEYVEWLVGG